MYKVLIADDEEPIHGLLRRALPKERYELIDAATGAQALEQARRDRPDLILLDVHMPGKDGLMVLRELRGDARTRLVPVVLMTGDSEPADQVRGLDEGADDYIGKPFDLGEFVARIASLLRRSARDLAANPLTRLPGSPGIEEEVGRRLAASTAFSFMYVDIDRFKAYNDVYGYARGDAMLRETGEILSEAVLAEDGARGFVGHIGGDDFVVVCSPDSAEAIARNVAGLFDACVPSFYRETDMRRGFIDTPDRQGRPCRYPPVSLSIGGVATPGRALRPYAKVVELAAEMKAYLKSRSGEGGSRYAFDRRRG